MSSSLPHTSIKPQSLVFSPPKNEGKSLSSSPPRACAARWICRQSCKMQLVSWTHTHGDLRANNIHLNQDQYLSLQAVAELTGARGPWLPWPMKISTAWIAKRLLFITVAKRCTSLILLKLEVKLRQCLQEQVFTRANHGRLEVATEESDLTGICFTKKKIWPDGELMQAYFSMFAGVALSSRSICFLLVNRPARRLDPLS